MDQFWGVLLFLVTAGAVLLLGVLTFVARLLPAEEDAGDGDLSSVTPTYYDNIAPGGLRSEAHFPPSRQEVEVEGKRGSTAEAKEPALLITEKALQLRLAEHYEQGAIDLYAYLSQRGFLTPGKATTIKAEFFKVGGGRALQRLNAAIDAVNIPPEAPEPAEPRRVTIAEGREGYVEI